MQKTDGSEVYAAEKRKYSPRMWPILCEILTPTQTDCHQGGNLAAVMFPLHNLFPLIHRRNGGNLKALLPGDKSGKEGFTSPPESRWSVRGFSEMTVYRKSYR